MDTNSGPGDGRMPSLLAIAIIALIVAIIVNILTNRHARAQGVGFIPAGTWVTSEKKGNKVCRLTQTIYYRMTTPGVGFCTDWQIPYQPMMRGQQWPIGEGWVRFAPSLQFHTEQGWKP